MKNLSTNLKKFEGKKIALFGDLMVDHYIQGDATRISPEAPIPIITVKSESYSLGGAANVASNIKKLGAVPIVFGSIGIDDAGQRLKTIFRQQNISSENLSSFKDRPTILKTRIIAHHQQVVRVDFEKEGYIEKFQEEEILKKFKKIAPECNGIILEDYNKGFLSAHMIEKIIKIGNENKIPIAVDPKIKNFYSYKNCSLFKPNLQEFCKIAGIQSDDNDFDKYAKDFLEKLACEFLIITKGEQGLSVYCKNSDKIVNIPTVARDVYDVSGAGDTVISVLTLCLSVGMDIISASKIANHAAGVCCGKIGAVWVSQQEILESFKKNKN